MTPGRTRGQIMEHFSGVNKGGSGFHLCLSIKIHKTPPGASHCCCARNPYRNALFHFIHRQKFRPQNHFPEFSTHLFHMMWVEYTVCIMETHYSVQETYTFHSKRDCTCIICILFKEVEETLAFKLFHVSQ